MGAAGGAAAAAEGLGSCGKVVKTNNDGVACSLGLGFMAGV